MAQIHDDLRNCFPSAGPLHDYVHFMRTVTHAPPALHVACSVPLVAYELARRGFKLAMFDSLNIWIGMIAPPAAAKTFSLRQVQRFSEDVYQRVFGNDLAPQPWISFEGSLPGVLHHIASLKKPELPYVPGILCHTEGSKVFSAKEGNSETLCQIYDGDKIKQHLRYMQKAAAEGEEVADEIPPMQMSALLTTTRAALQNVLKLEMLEGGLYSRLLWLYEKLNQVDLQPWPTPNAQGRDALVTTWASWLRTLDGLRAGHNLRPEIQFSDEALAFLKDHLFESLKPFMTMESLEASVAVRVMPHAARIAACYAATQLEHRIAFTTSGAHLVVQEDDARRAANIVLRAYHSSMRIGRQGTVQHASISDKRGRIAAEVNKAGIVGLSKRDLYALFGGNIDKKALDQLVAELEESEEVISFRMNTGGRGRPAVRYFDATLYDVLIETAAKNGVTTKQ